MPDTNVASGSNLLESVSLKDRVALVTGGSRGIGRAAVECFVKLGANVIVNYVRDEKAASGVVTEAEASGVGAMQFKRMFQIRRRLKDWWMQLLQAFWTRRFSGLQRRHLGRIGD